MSIIQRHPRYREICKLATQVLEEHAPKNSYWSSRALALELLRFLQIKQLVLRSRPTEDNNSGADPLSVSPGFLVDALWHAVLLESEVRQSLDEMLGGHVPHSAADARFLTDEQKLARQLTALNLMAMEGWTPTLHFWEQPGTAMHKVLQVSNDGMTLFFPRGLPAREVAAFAQTFLHAVGLCSPARLLAAAVDAANADAARVQARPVRRAARAGYAGAAARGPGRGAPGGGSITLYIQNLTGKHIPVSVPQTGIVAHIVRGVTEADGIPPEQQRLIFNGKVLQVHCFLQDVGLTDGAVVHLVLRLSGC